MSNYVLLSMEAEMMAFDSHKIIKRIKDDFEVGQLLYKFMDN